VIQSFLLRFLGRAPAGPPPSGTTETETVRRIAARLARLEPDAARYLAAFAYVLARVAQADLRITETETETMHEIVQKLSGLPPEEAALAVEIAKSQARLLGGTENYVVTREYRRISSPEQRQKLVECLYAVAAADGTISNAESVEIGQIAEELGFLREDLVTLRAAYRDKLSEFKDLPGSD
jgi:uncharacterized tellurite resistance protein B-like protein